MVPNFNLNYLSCMFLDIARFETTTTIYQIQILGFVPLPVLPDISLLEREKYNI